MRKYWFTFTKKEIMQEIINELLEIADQRQIKLDINKMKPMWFLYAVYELVQYVKADINRSDAIGLLHRFSKWDKDKEDE